MKSDYLSTTSRYVVVTSGGAGLKPEKQIYDTFKESTFSCLKGQIDDRQTVGWTGGQGDGRTDRHFLLDVFFALHLSCFHKVVT